MRERIIDVLRAAERPLSWKEIAHRAGVSPTSSWTRVVLAQLRRESIIDLDTEGYYLIARVP